MCGLRCQVREAMMSPVKVPKPCKQRRKQNESRSKREGTVILVLAAWNRKSGIRSEKNTPDGEA